MGGPGPGGGSAAGSPPQGLGAVLALGQGAIGAHVHVFWAQRSSWYAARVISCSPPQRSIMVQYEGGRQDVLDLAKENVEFRIRLLSTRPPMAM